MRNAECTDRAVLLDSTNPKYLLARGQLSLEGKQFREAVEFFSRGLGAGADPRNWSRPVAAALIAAIIVLVRRGQPV